MPSRQTLRPRLLVLLCASFAVATGVLYLHMAGAPVRYIAINLGALLLGAVMLLPAPLPSGRTAGVMCLSIGVLLNATALFGQTMHGVSRWIAVGGLSLEPGLILFPLGLLLFALHQDGLSATGIVLAAIATAVQPDRSMAGALALSLITLWLVARTRWTLVPCVVAIAAFAVTLFRADTVPPAPFVEKVFASAFELSLPMGLAVAIAGCLLLLPAFFGLRRGGAHKGVQSAFAAVWVGLLLASVLGNYPTPLVGYGSSAILGYLVSAICLVDKHGQDAF